MNFVGPSSSSGAVGQQNDQTSSTTTSWPVLEGDEPGRKMLDLVFLQDATGSMGSYIASATRNIESICQQIIAYEGMERPEDLRIAIVSYRDHPPQDRTYVTQTLPFTSSIAELKKELGSLTASGGGDGPEASTAAMYQALTGLNWRRHSAKMMVLVTDAPPHGIGEVGDGFPQGDPDGHDPLLLAREMAARGITFFVVACEPNLSSYRHGIEFYQAICDITSGIMLPLTTADVLAHAIVGSVLENFDVERIVRSYGQEISNRIGGDIDSIDAVAQELHERLMLMGQVTKKVKVERIYNETAEYKHNLKTWTEAANLADGRSRVVLFRGNRYTEAYRASRYNTGPGSYYPYRPTLPPRSGRTASPTPPLPASVAGGSSSAAKASTTGGAPAKKPRALSSRRYATRGSMMDDDDDDEDAESSDLTELEDSDEDDMGGGGAGGTTTKPTSDFKAFSAAGTTPSRIGAAAATGFSPPSTSDRTKPMFSAPRGGGAAGGHSGMDSDEDEDEENGGRLVRGPGIGGLGGSAQEIGLEEDPISLEQAKRIAQQSIWRMRA